MPHYRWDEVPREQMNPNIARRVVHCERLTLAQLEIKKGGIVPLHDHHHEQVTYVLRGRLRFRTGDRDQEVGAGEILETPPGAPHTVEALEDTVCLDVFSPVRDDWQRGEDAYLRR